MASIQRNIEPEHGDQIRRIKKNIFLNNMGNFAKKWVEAHFWQSLVDAGHFFTTASGHPDPELFDGNQGDQMRSWKSRPHYSPIHFCNKLWVTFTAEKVAQLFMLIL
jgi:hypothetical protein